MAIPVTAVVVMEKALALVRQGFCRGHDAETAAGYPVTVTWSTAASFSCSGAVVRACYDLRVPTFDRRQLQCFHAIEEAAGCRSLGLWETTASAEEAVLAMANALALLQLAAIPAPAPEQGASKHPQGAGGPGEEVEAANVRQ